MNRAPAAGAKTVSRASPPLTRTRTTGLRRGNVAIEFALSFTVLWAVLSGALEIGYSTYTYMSLSKAVADGAIFASRASFEEPGTDYANRVRNMVVYGSPTPEGQPLAPSLAAANVTVTWARDAAGVPETVTVAISGYKINALFRTYTLTNRPAVTVRYMGQYITP